MHPHSRLALRLLEWRARRIADPVERLRFLQRASRRTRHRRRMPAAIALTLFMPPCGGPPAVSERLEPAVPAPPPGAVWLVEQGDDFELYSSGLRIETAWATSGRPRSYVVFTPEGRVARRRSEPAGIVFHSSESDLAAFAPEQAPRIVRQSRELLAYARRRGLYHFLIDRPGRVYRLVHEDCAAVHAGRSVWADATGVYVNLNQSFLGVCFEGHGPNALTPAQERAGRALTEMLRAKYGIEGANCVTHAQVSVNPANWRVGYHTDWAAGLPFAALGLPENYRQPPAGLTVFGFEFDAGFLATAGTPLRSAVLSADAALGRTATVRGISPARLRAELRKGWCAADSIIRGAE